MASSSSSTSATMRDDLPPSEASHGTPEKAATADTDTFADRSAARSPEKRPSMMARVSSKLSRNKPEYGPEAVRWGIPYWGPRSIPPPPPSMEDRPLLPEHSASPFSKLVFLWIQPMMLLGYRRPLEQTDLWPLDESRSARHLADEFLMHMERRRKQVNDFNAKLDAGYKPHVGERLWFRVRSTFGFGDSSGRRKFGIVLAISDVFFYRFWLGGVFKVLSDLLSVFTPLVTRYLIQHGTNVYLAARGVPGYEYPNPANGYGAAVGLLLMLVASSLLLHHFFYRSMSTGVLLRGMLINAIYRRALVMTGKARVAIPSSRLVNHISTDVSRIDFCAGFFHMSWTAPIQFIVITVLLLIEIGPSCLVGIAMLLIAIPVQGKIMGKIFAARRESMVYSDRRAKLTQELLGNVKILKLFAWETPFLEKLNSIRLSELKLITRLLTIKALNMSIALSIPTLATVVAFAVYITTGHENSPASIFTSLTLFTLLRMPLMVLPMSLGTIADARNALGRLAEVFESETTDISLNVQSDLKNAIEIRNADFAWEGTPPEPVSAPGAGGGGRGGRSGGGGKAAASTRGAKSGAASGGRLAFRGRKKAAAVAQSAPIVEQKTPGDTEAVDHGGSVAAQTGPDQAAHISEKAVSDVKVDEFMTLRDINLTIPQGSLVAVCGPVGSGKSSLLQGLIGEMKRTKGDVVFHGSVGYCSQVAWIQNATLRENVLFGRPYDAERYKRVIHDASLEADLRMLPHGDEVRHTPDPLARGLVHNATRPSVMHHAHISQTQIGEKGITLSGGQRQRVNIARALYFGSDIVCLDDPLSAVDAHVGRALFEDAICGALHGKTRILVTHALHFLKRPEVDQIITMDQGRIAEVGSYTELIARDGPFARLMAQFGGGEDEQKAEDEQEAIEHARKAADVAPEAEKPKDAHVLMQEEERTRGSVGWPVWKSFFVAGNGAVWMPLLIVSLILTQASTVLSAYTLVWWQRDVFSQSTGFYIGLYAGFGVLLGLFMFGVGLSALFMGMRVSRTIHKEAAYSVMHAPVSFFDTTPLGRIQGRFTKDLDTLDNNLNDSARMAINTLGSVVGSIVLIAIITPYFLIAVAVLLIGYWGASKFYRSSARELKRIDNLLRSACYAHFAESLTGLATIRAYGEADRFTQVNEQLIDHENRAYYLTVVNQRWLGMRLDLCGAFLVFVVAILTVATASSLDPSQIGLALSYIISVQAAFSWVVRQTAEVENDMNSFERLDYYSHKLEQERAPEIAETTPPKSWPAQGDIVLDNVQMAYRPGLPLVLKGLSLHIKGGESLGVVGRTGAGKSSIMIALFRMVELSGGSIKIDGLDISTLGLADLRRKLAIIPQDALLFEGTIRTNLDPFNSHSDAELWDALRRAHLIEKPSLPEIAEERSPTHGDSEKSRSPSPERAKSSRFSLDMTVTDNGDNLSVGERSLVSLARALVRNAQVVLLDEATASVDYATDSKIQGTIASEFRGKTLVTIAHRLVTIISYDRVLVMDAGNIAEVATPVELYKQGGIFRSMCERSNISLDDIHAAQAARRNGAAPPPDLLRRATSLNSSAGNNVNPL